MRKFILSLIICLFIILIYFSIFNFLISFRFNFSIEDNLLSQGTAEVVGVGDSVSVTVIRDRFYGKLIEQGDIKTAVIFSFLKIPIEKNGKNLILIHLFFIIILFLFGIRFDSPKSL